MALTKVKSLITGFTPMTVSKAGLAEHSGGFSADITGNYTTPTGVKKIRVRGVGGGGGGGGGSSAGNNNGVQGGTGGTTYFRVGASPDLLVANGGVGGFGFNGNPSAGGTASIGTGPIGFAVTGSSSNCGGIAGTLGYISGGNGGASALGGQGAGGGPTVAGNAAPANTGGGGGGAGSPVAGYAGAGGGSGGYFDAIIFPTAGQVFAYACGAAGTAGTAGTGGAAGAAGSGGYLIVEEYYE